MIECLEAAFYAVALSILVQNWIPKLMAKLFVFLW